MFQLLLKNRDFSLLWGSQVVSQAGTRMFQIALSWWVLTQMPGGSGLSFSLILIAGALPGILLVKWIGKTVELTYAKKLLTLVDGFGILVSLFLCYLFHLDKVSLSIALIFVFGFAILQALIEPTLNKNVTSIVDEKDMGNAMGFLSSTQTIAGFLGAVVGASLIETSGILFITLLNAGSFFVSLICDQLIRFQKPINGKINHSEAHPTTAQDSIWKKLDHFPPIRSLLLSFAATNFFSTAVLIVIPLYIKNVLKLDATALAYSEAAIWLGLILGSTTSGFLGLKERTLQFIQLSLMSYAFFIGIASIGLDFVTYPISLLLAGYCIGAINVRMIIFFQTTLPDAIKGRFFALLQAVVGSAIPIGYFVFGALSTKVPNIYLPLIQAIGVFVVSLSFSRMESIPQTSQSRI